MIEKNEPKSDDIILTFANLVSSDPEKRRLAMEAFEFDETQRIEFIKTVGPALHTLMIDIKRSK